MSKMVTMCEVDPDVVRWGLHQIEVCSLPARCSSQNVTCYEKDLPRVEPVKEYICCSTPSALENDEVQTHALKEGLSGADTAEPSGYAFSVEVCSLPVNCSSQTVSWCEKDLSTVESVREEFSSSTPSALENDEVLAHALQEELSRLDAAVALGSAFITGKHQKASVLAQDWLGPPGPFSNSGDPEGEKEESSLSGLEELSIRGEEVNHLPDIEDESNLDGELAKRLNEMVPVPHVPKINGEIPSADEALSDHERLLSRLQLYDLIELKISGDGNCQFLSLSDQIYRTPDQHKFVREQVVNQLKSEMELYKNYVPMAYGDYLKKMSKNGEWGDHVTLQAAADWFGIKIFILTSFKDTCYIEILPQLQKSNRIIFLSFWAEVHYNSIYPIEEFPDVERKEAAGKKKKRWWS